MYQLWYNILYKGEVMEISFNKDKTEVTIKILHSEELVGNNLQDAIKETGYITTDWINNYEGYDEAILERAYFFKYKCEKIASDKIVKETTLDDVVVKLDKIIELLDDRKDKIS
jgi:hypothetical protein